MALMISERSGGARCCAATRFVGTFYLVLLNTVIRPFLNNRLMPCRLLLPLFIMPTLYHGVCVEPTSAFFVPYSPALSISSMTISTMRTIHHCYGQCVALPVADRPFALLPFTTTHCCQCYSVYSNICCQ